MGKARGADALRRSTPQVKTRPQVPPLGMIRRRPLNPQDGARETAVLGGTPDRESIRTMRTKPTRSNTDGRVKLATGRAAPVTPPRPNGRKPRTRMRDISPRRLSTLSGVALC